LLQLAKQLGLDEKQFTHCLASGRAEQQVWLNATEAEKLGLTATPSFFINQQTLNGNISYQQLSTIIESELNK
jgi:protein-disulfide isomerase